MLRERLERLALGAPTAVEGPDISLSPTVLPVYALLSTGRMVAAYALSLLFTLVYGYVAAYNRRAEVVLMPLLDVLQSVPILSFLPVVLLSLSAVLPEAIAVGLASIVLIFTSQAWNMTFAWYQSLTTIPMELREASSIFRFNRWLRLKTLELPFGANSLIWNSMMSWAGGWFFLMAAEIFTVGQRDFRLPGLGAYLSEAAAQGDRQAILLGIVALVAVIVPVMTIVGDTEEERAPEREHLRAMLSFYGSTPNYAFIWDEAGFEGTTARIRGAGGGAGAGVSARGIVEELLRESRAWT